MKVIRKKSDRLEKIARAISGKDRNVAVGFPKSKSTASNIEKAIWNEFGTTHGFRGALADGFSMSSTYKVGIPERPFMRNTMRSNKSKYKQFLKKMAEGILDGTVDLETSLNRLGILVQGDVQKEITSLKTPPNAPSTIKKKKSSNPLIDTGAMRQAVTWELRK